MKHIPPKHASKKGHRGPAAAALLRGTFPAPAPTGPAETVSRKSNIPPAGQPMYGAAHVSYGKG